MGPVASDVERSADPVPEEFLRERAPRIETEEVAQCPVCGDGRFKEHAIGYDYELRTCANAWRFVACLGCGHVWLNPRPSLTTLRVIYPPTYYAYNYDTQINSIAVRGKAMLDKAKLRGIVRYLKREPRSYLDVGCGDGRFLRVMERMGIPRAQLYGLELDERVVAPLAASGFRVRCERVEESESIPPEGIDLITMFHVIEHVDNPKEVVRKLVSWLRPGGVLALETPNIDSVDSRLFSDSYWGGYHFPRHWNLFTPRSLARLLRDGGLEVRATRYMTGHSFWMYSLHHRLRYGSPAWPRLAALFNPFRGLPFLVGFTALDIARSRLGFRTSSMLMLATKPES
ncbi:MAG TPA: class I SAM-dependent methyltransferase [Gemmatimonadaceae bacterium]|nr:class I SAM-dependent methyltransferase [Gemmatimonadaceae bacterium]